MPSKSPGIACGCARSGPGFARRDAGEAVTHDIVEQLPVTSSRLRTEPAHDSCVGLRTLEPRMDRSTCTSTTSGSSSGASRTSILFATPAAIVVNMSMCGRRSLW